MTLANGVKREMRVANLGARALTSIPKRTGNKTTRAVAVHKVHPEMAIVLPTSSFTKIGVATEARIVEHDEHGEGDVGLCNECDQIGSSPSGGTSHETQSKNKALPCVGDELSSKVLPMAKAVMGMIMN
eukprot:CAMPEP_0168240730 /NCGR_PEP_ID=MMETSP0140_2-20121125/22365_1 /TAXON_ID=44445 /ORGANISM="Pseudo-nitzschia australis, Strain 10249 10 AB" /LENGTH=128 /DNA_ID=CAMNT_0008175429 /DNA_START=336 /DNA_END=723 /DNA_ORIENTATION=-